MKKVMVAIVLAVGALVGYNFLTTGQLSILPSSSLTAEEQELEDLASEFDTARDRFHQAGRAAGMTGIDSSADAEAAILNAKRVEKALDELKGRLTSDPAREKARKLEREIEEFMRGLR